MIRLGEGVFLKGRLDPTAIRRTLQAFVSFQKTAQLLRISKMIAFGTCALREATDAEDLVEKVRRRTGIEIRVISGQEEAELIALGILDNTSLQKEKFGLIDIGGGSTEISLCHGRKVLHAESFSLGASRLQQLFLKTNPPPATDGNKNDTLTLLRHSIKSILLPRMVSDRWPTVSNLLGSSGTIRSLEKILRKKPSSAPVIERKALARLVKQMTPLSLPELLKIPGMEPKRADIILAGAILLEECMDALGASQVSTTTYSLRDGILDREIRLLSHQGNISQEPRIQFELKDLEAKAKNFGIPASHFRQVCYLAESIFDQTARVHQLQVEWKRYLTAAAIMHDTGRAIAPTHHENHSYYIVKNASFLSMEKWESEFIGQLCLHHGSNRFSKEDLGFTRDKTRRRAFTYLLGILRVADALDRTHRSGIRINKTILKPGKIQFNITAKAGADLEILRVDQKKELFEKTFQRKLEILSS